MLAERGNNLEIISSVLSSYAYHIIFQAHRNLQDEAKGAEDSLLDVVNLAYNCNFMNLNNLEKNFPGIDWRAGNNGIGLQVTTTKTWKKISSTIDTIIRNKIDCEKEIWFLFISNDKYSPKQKSYNGYTIKSITILDLLNKISCLSDLNILELKNDMLVKLKAWTFDRYTTPTSSYVYNSYSAPQSDLKNFITHHDLWSSLGNDTNVAQVILEQIQNFASQYSQLPPIARTVIAKAILYAPQPGLLNWQIEINIDVLWLYLSEDEKSSFHSIVSLLKTKDLGCITEKDHKMIECENEVIITHTPYLELNWLMCEPYYDIFTSLKSFYSIHLSEEKLFRAFETSNFSEVN